MSDSATELGCAPVGRLLFKLAVPTIAAQIVNMLYNIVDRIYIGHIPDVGSQALTGVGVTFPIILLISAFSALIGMGGAPRAAQMSRRCACDFEAGMRTLPVRGPGKMV